MCSKNRSQIRYDQIESNHSKTKQFDGNLEYERTELEKDWSNIDSIHNTFHEIGSADTIALYRR